MSLECVREVVYIDRTCNLHIAIEVGFESELLSLSGSNKRLFPMFLSELGGAAFFRGGTTYFLLMLPEVKFAAET